MSVVGSVVQRGRVPVQQRARTRVAALLDAAGDELVAGGAPLNLTAVAERAGVPIGSLYQYFPSHAALIRGVAERHLGDAGGGIVDLLGDGPIGVADLDVALRAYLSLCDDPLAVAVMRAISADPALRELDRADTLDNVERVLLALRRSGVRLGPDLRTQVELAIELAGALVLVLADSPTNDRRRLADAFVSMTLAPLTLDS